MSETMINMISEDPVSAEAEVVIDEAEVKKPYEFRKLAAPDMFLMFKIIGKIGVDEFKVCFEDDGIKKLVAVMANAPENQEKSLLSVGVGVALEIANVIFNNLPKCESEIYQMLANTSNLKLAEVKQLDMATFTEMVIDFIQKEEFKDFIKVVSKLFK